MLVPDNVNPKLTIYYNAAFVLKILLQEEQVAKILPLYELIIKNKKMSLPIFLLSLDWLYLLDLVDINEQGEIALCI